MMGLPRVLCLIEVLPLSVHWRFLCLRLKLNYWETGLRFCPPESIWYHIDNLIT